MYMKRVFCGILATIMLTACSKDELGLFENGFISVNGVKVQEINYGYEANMETIGSGKANWKLFDQSQKKGDLDYDHYHAYLRAATDPTTFKPYPFTVFITNIPGYKNIYIDGLYPTENGDYFLRVPIDATPDGPVYAEYYVTVNKFSYNSSCTNLKADIVIKSDQFDYEVRLVYSGSTPNDGVDYYLD